MCCWHMPSLTQTANRGHPPGVKASVPDMCMFMWGRDACLPSLLSPLSPRAFLGGWPGRNYHSYLRAQGHVHTWIRRRNLTPVSGTQSLPSPGWARAALLECSFSNKMAEKANVCGLCVLLILSLKFHVYSFRGNSDHCARGLGMVSNKW